ncbi:hypothetical protein M8J75_000718, partial [Diaphorina citri]
MSCGKCSLELNKEDGYIKCYGCSTRYHFQCSLSSSTWKAKSQRLKEEWRCEACREQAAIAAGKTVSKTGMDVRVSVQVRTPVRDERVGGNVNTQDRDGWTTVGNRRSRNNTAPRNPPKIGTKAIQAGNSSTPMVRRKVPSIKTSALFVTRFSPNVTVQDIKDLINASLTLSHLKISKIQSKHQDQYSSFHVEVLVSDYSKIDDVSLWPDGCLMKQYRGRLLPEIVVSDTSSDTSVNTAAPGTSVNSTPRDAT